MPFYEVVYEDGSASVAFYDGDEEASIALTAANERAKSGGKSVLSAANSPAATRVKAVYKYDAHPGDYNPDATMSSEVLSSEIKKMLKDESVVNLWEVAAKIRDLSNPFHEETKVHESKFKMQETETLAPALWGGE